VQVPADTWLFSLEKHPETHTDRNTCMVHSFDIFWKWYDELRWTCPANDVTINKSIIITWKRISWEET